MTHTTNDLATIPAGSRVRISLRGRGVWNGTLVKGDDRGADLRGTRGAPLMIVRNAHIPDLLTAITNHCTSHIVESIEVV